MDHLPSQSKFQNGILQKRRDSSRHFCILLQAVFGVVGRLKRQAEARFIEARKVWANNNKGLPITILNSGTHHDVSTNDWSDAMQWLKENTPEDAVIASWWDYGYWISTLGERKTLSDNATLIDWQIRKSASMF
ncbi:MAG: hypothetical protein JKY95_11145, partial [Planctomycetaceae bacterium]|nr:hypothetical protein [Planctomycetaceae bacterium]